MCRSFQTKTQDVEAVARSFDLASNGIDLLRAAPSMEVPIVHRRGKGAVRCEPVRWGVATEKRGKTVQMTECAAQSTTQSPQWAHAFSTWRCLVPCGGYYEWFRDRAKVWHPFMVCGPAREPLAIAGVCMSNPVGTGGYRKEFAVVTTEAGLPVNWMSTWQPVFVPPQSWETWLDPARSSMELLQEFVPFSQGVQRDIFPVCRRVNYPRTKITPEDVAPREWWHPEMARILRALHRQPLAREGVSAVSGLAIEEVDRVLGLLEDMSLVWRDPKPWLKSKPDEPQVWSLNCH